MRGIDTTPGNDINYANYIIGTDFMAVLQAREAIFWLFPNTTAEHSETSHEIRKTNIAQEITPQLSQRAATGTCDLSPPVMLCSPPPHIFSQIKTKFS